MRAFVPVVTVILALSGCVSGPSHQSSNGQQAARLVFVGAKNDLMPSIRTPQVRLDVDETIGQTTVTAFPLTYAVSCNVEMTSCNHAVVSTVLEARYTRDGAKLRVAGTLRSEMGRSLTFSSRAGTETMSVPESVPLIGSKVEEKSIDYTLTSGSKFELEGLGGVTIELIAK